MRSRTSRIAILAGLLLLVVPGPGASQERDVISKEIAVAENEAALHLELAGGDAVDVRLSAGEVRIGDRVVGAYEAGGELESAWRALLGQAVALDNGPLARALVAWDPPALEGDAGSIAAELDRALEDALRVPTPAPAPAAPGLSGSQEALVQGLLGRTTRLLELAEAVEDLDDDDQRSLTLHLDEDVVVAQGETVEGGLLVVDGDVRVAGDVEGSVVLVGGSLTLEEGGRVSGDIRLADDARLYRDGGEVEGSVESVRSTDRDDLERELREELRSELRDELREEIRHDIRETTRIDMDGGWNPLRSVGRGLGGLLENLVSVLVLGVLMGGLAVHFAPRNLDVVTQTVREAPLRAAMVGVAGAFVALPAWVLGFVALAISIVGILAIPFWAVLFPLAVAAGIALGYVAVAQILGEWVARQHYERLDWVRLTNPYSTVIAGVGALMLAFILSNVLEMAGPWTTVFQGILIFLGVVGSLAAALMGFGAVLLTRGGRRPEYHGGGFDDWDLDLGSPPPAGPAPSGPVGGGHGAGFSSGGAGMGGSGTGAPASGAPASGTERGTAAGDDAAEPASGDDRSDDVETRGPA